MAGKGRVAVRARQRGDLLMVRAMAVVAVLVLLLAIPLWMKHERDKRAEAQGKKEDAVLSGAATQPAKGLVPAAAPIATAQAASATPTLGHGLTYAVVVDDQQLPPEVARLGCSGEPRATDRPLQDNAPCNPKQGDTSCRVVLPVLCIQPGTAAKPAGGGETTYAGWTGGMLAPTQPVMGAILNSAAAASARCEKELGSGWRMADAHDGQNSGGLQGLRTSNTALDRGTRYWVQVKDQPANCWNSGS